MNCPANRCKRALKPMNMAKGGLPPSYRRARSGTPGRPPLHCRCLLTTGRATRFIPLRSLIHLWLWKEFHRTIHCRSSDSNHAEKDTGITTTAAAAARQGTPTSANRLDNPQLAVWTGSRQSKRPRPLPFKLLYAQSQSPADSCVSLYDNGINIAGKRQRSDRKL